MDVRRTRAHANATMTEDEKTRQQKEGRCFQCNRKGHISCNCPQKSSQVAEASSSNSNTVVATATIMSNKALSADQKVEIYLTQLYNKDDEVCTCFMDIMFNKEDFSHA